MSTLKADWLLICVFTLKFQNHIVLFLHLDTIIFHSFEDIVLKLELFSPVSIPLKVYNWEAKSKIYYFFIWFRYVYKKGRAIVGCWVGEEDYRGKWRDNNLF